MTRPELESHVSLRKPRILLVDDEPAVRRGLTRVLASGQPLWEIEVAENGLDALEKMALRRYDVLVTDLHMPKMDGLVLLEQVSRRYPEVIRIVHSSRIDTHSAKFLRRLAHEVLVKPATAMQILTTTNQALERSAWDANGPASTRFDGPTSSRFDGPASSRFDGPVSSRFDGPVSSRFNARASKQVG